MNIPFSEGECDIIRIYWEIGETAKQIARRLGRSQHSIGEKAKKIGLQPRVAGAPRSWSDDRVQILVDCWKAGQSAPEIGRTLGISPAAVLNKSTRLRLPRRFIRSGALPARRVCA